MPLSNKEAYNEYMNDYLKMRYARRRALWIEKLGGVCVDCGASGDLQFDHADALTKVYSIAKLLTSASEEKLSSEMAKCVLRCQPCHHLKSLRCKDYQGMRKR